MDDLQNIEGFGFTAVSLGYFDTLMSCSASSTSSEMDDESLQAAGIQPGLVRMSVGFTGSMEQRWEQLERAMVRAGLMEATTGKAVAVAVAVAVTAVAKTKPKTSVQVEPAAAEATASAPAS
jgi:hypothetical protein